MDDLIRIPCVLMRGGTSKGPYFIASDLPTQIEARDRVLVSAMGAGNLLEIDGIGGGHPLTSKVAIVSPSRVPGADVDYLFAQVRVEQRLVDTSPNCGNMIAGVGPFAIEAGMVSAQDGETRVRIFNVNTGKLIEAKVATPGARSSMTAMPLSMVSRGLRRLSISHFLALLARRRVNCCLPAVRSIGWTVSRYPASTRLCRSSLSVHRISERRVTRAGRIQCRSRVHAPSRSASDRGGQTDGHSGCGGSVIPKPVLIAPPANGGTISARYFMPHSCHAALAITGSVAVATAAVTPGTLAHAMVGDHALPVMFAIEHPSGRLEVTLDHHPDYVEPAAYVVRTARRLFEGHVLVKASEIYLASSTAA